MNNYSSLEVFCDGKAVTVGVSAQIGGGLDQHAGEENLN